MSTETSRRSAPRGCSRQMIGLSALAEAEPEALVRVLAPLFERLVDGGRDAGA